MKKGGLLDFLWNNAGEQMEVETTIYGSFVGVSHSVEEDCGENYDELGWNFDKINGVEYSCISLKDIARVRLVGETDWAWDISQTAQQKYLQAV
ncbi:MAG: hypothetical protein FWG68_04140 [Defluviitaleaceae bacterium]|nr:hypothetical protein [Defluviitaleaceae bacterium]